MIVKIEKILNDNRKGKIIFDSISVSSITKFPNIEVKIFNLKMIDSLYENHKRETIFLEEVSTSISIIDAFNEEIKITAISAKKGLINIFVDDDHYTNTYVFGANKKKNPEAFSLKIIDNDVDVLIENIEFTFIEKIKNKRITAHLNKVDFTIDVANLKIPNVNLDVLMKEMGLNLEKGTFFNNARCVGSFQPIFYQNLNTIEIPKFNLKIEDQDFEVAAFFDIHKHTFSFLLNLDKSHFTQTNRLLANNIKKRLEGFDIIKPFKVNAKISGKFVYLDKTLVELEYETLGNEIFYKKDSLFLKNVSFNGTFINRVYMDKNREEPRKNYTFSFKNISGVLDSIPINLTHVALVNDVPKPLHLSTEYKVDGEIEHLNNFINSKDYNFTKGNFKINGKFHGEVNTLTHIIESSEMEIYIKNLHIKSKHNLGRFYVPVFHINLDDNQAEIRNISVAFNKKERIKIHGTIGNFGSLLANNTSLKPTRSNLSFTSDYINFNSLLKSFGTHKKNTTSKNLSQVKNSMNVLANKFNPKINFTLKELVFFDIPYSNININAQYKNKNIDIKNISGNYKDGDASAKINVGLSPKKNAQNKEVLQLDIALKVNGKIEHWAEIFNNKNFFFNDANYTLDMSFNDYASSIPELVNKSTLTLNVSEGSMFYKPANITLPFNNISISIKNKNAFLNDFDLKLPNNQSLHLKGQINNFIEIIEEDIKDYSITSSITVFSKDINFSNFMDTFNPNSQKSEKKNNVKIILKEIYTKFKPTLKLDFEKLTYNSVTLENVNASLLFKDINTLTINNAYCYFYDEKLTLDAAFDIGQDTQTKFTTNFSLNNFAIENLMHSFNNFGFKKLDEPAEIIGIINLNADFKGVIDDAKGVVYESLEADLFYNIKKLNLNNFQPIIDAGNIVFRKKRFEEIKFANINSTLILKNNIITIPSTNVQSTAFDFFIEGKLDNTSHTDLWISIPLSNLKRRDLTQAPSNKDYNEAGRKIYLEIKASEKGKLEHKVHLRDKKHFKTSQK